MDSSDESKRKKYKCPIEGCNAAYSRPFKLKVHKIKHTGERPFVCDIAGCSKTYMNQVHLKRHKCFVHEQTSEVMCGVRGCGLVLNNKYSLKKHVKRKHNTTNYAFTCHECSQGFEKKKQLIKHIYLHTGEVPFKCSSCNIAFTSLHKYNKHKRNHKTYTCDCGATFDRWSLFCAHRRTSCSIKKIDHKCIICNKIFLTNSNLTRHSLTHLEESHRDIYRCPYIDCKRSYLYKKNLTYHIAAFHEKLKSEEFICGEPGCEQVLKSKKNLKMHIRNMHSNLPKKNKERKPRKDKDKPKKCMASVMSGVQLSLKEHLTVINDSNENNGVVLVHKSAVDTNTSVVDNQTLNKKLSELDNTRSDQQLKFTELGRLIIHSG